MPTELPDASRVCPPAPGPGGSAGRGPTPAVGGPGRRWAALAAGILALALAGCGFGAGATTSKQVAIKVTTGFGSHTIASHTLGRIPQSWSVMQFTEHYFKLQTSSGGGFVDAIDGAADASGQKRDWFYYVNGIEAPKGAAGTPLHAGDHVWWDLHDWRATQDVPAVVGSYPEPFRDGSDGKRFPTVVTCASGLTQACDVVTKSLTRAGVKVSFQGLGTGSGSDSLAVLVGTYSQLKGVIASELLQAGPKVSGVYAQFVGNTGQVLELDDPAGDVVATLRGSAGLVAATQQPGLNEPVWLITGTNAAGVRAAAAALTPATLANHFAVAVQPAGRVLPLPLSPAS